MVKIKSVKIYSFIDDEDGTSELFWLNGKLIKHTSIEYMVRACNGINDGLGFRKFKKVKVIDRTKSDIINQCKNILREYIRKKTRNFKISLKNFVTSQCHCDLCVNELPIIITEKKSKYPKNEEEWFDYLRVLYFCIVKQQKYVVDFKEPKDGQPTKYDSSSSEDDDDDEELDEEDYDHGDDNIDMGTVSKYIKKNNSTDDSQPVNLIENSNSNEEGENDENDNLNRYQDIKEYYVYTKDLFEYLFIHRKLLEIELLFQKHSTTDIKQMIVNCLCNWQNTFKNGRQYLGYNGYWTLTDPKDDPWYDIDIPSDEGESRIVNGKAYKICGAPTSRGKCQRIGNCPSHPKINYVSTSNSSNVIYDEFELQDSSDESSDYEDFNPYQDDDEDSSDENSEEEDYNNKKSTNNNKKKVTNKSIKSKTPPKPKPPQSKLKPKPPQSKLKPKSKPNNNANNNNNNISNRSINNSSNKPNIDLLNNLNQESIKKIKVSIDDSQERIEKEILSKSIPNGLCKNYSPLKIENQVLENYSFTSLLEQSNLLQYKDTLPKEYVRFLILKIADNDYLPQSSINNISLFPPPLINKLWLTHITNTRKYKGFCSLLGSEVSVSCNPEMMFEPKDSLITKYERLKELYVYSFSNYKFYSKKNPSDYFNECFKSVQDIWVDNSQL